MSRRKDTVNMLRECNSGIIMGASAIEKVLPMAKNKEIREVLDTCKNTHKELGDETHRLLLLHGSDTKPQHRFAKMMSDKKIDARMMMRASDKTIASLMTDGSNMGIKSLSSFLNKYKDADAASRSIAKRLIASEEYMAVKMRDYL